LALVWRHGIVAAVTRTVFDQFDKEMVRTAAEIHGPVVTDAEVWAAPRRIDLWFTPDPTRAPIPEYLGLLGRIIGGPSTLEFFHNTPNGEELKACLIKHGEFHHALSLRKVPAPNPTQWVISAGRPNDGIEGLGFRPLKGWPSGIYEAPRLHWTRLVVVSELPVARDTLLVRLLGADRVLKQAIAELKALPADAPERTLVLPILLRLRLDVPTDPAKQTADDQEFLMTTQDIVETWRRKAIEEGEVKARADDVLTVLRVRGIGVSEAARKRILAEKDLQRLERWHENAIIAASLGEVLDD
jgi:post-segregation antitoxin (ccd killing protein)